jgi:hypothetical protein
MIRQISAAGNIGLSSPPDKVNFCGMRPDLSATGEKIRTNRRPADTGDRHLMEGYFRRQGRLPGANLPQPETGRTKQSTPKRSLNR